MRHDQKGAPDDIETTHYIENRKKQMFFRLYFT